MKSYLSRQIILYSIFFCSMFCRPLLAGGFSSLHSLGSGTVSIANTQKRFSWVPAALLFQFDAPVSGTITVERQTGSKTFLLTSCVLSDNQHAVWIPAAGFTFKEGDSLTVTSTATNGTVEIIRKGE